MFRKTEGIVGLEINSRFIRAVELREIPKGTQVSKVETVPTPPGAIEEGRVVNENLIATAIENLFQGKGFNAKQVVMVLPEGTWITRTIKMPDIPIGEIKEVMRGEVEQYGLFPLQEAIFDFCILEKLREGNLKKVNLFLAVTQKSIIDSYTRILEKAGLELIAVNFPLQAVLRTLSPAELPSKDLTGLIIFGERIMEVTVLKGDIPRFVRNIELGTKLRDLTPEEINRSELSPILVEILDEVRRSFNYFQANLPEGESIKRILIIADEQKFHGLSDFMARSLNVDVKFASEASLSMGVGVAKHGTQRTVLDKITLLIPPSQRRSILTVKELTLTAGLVLSAIIPFVIAGLLLDRKIESNKNEMLLQQQKLNEARSVIEEISTERMERITIEGGLNEKIALLAQARYPALSQILIELSRSVPETIWLTEMSAEGDLSYIRLTGVAFSQSAINQFIKSLNTSYFFKMVTLSSTRLANISNQPVMRFSLGFQVVRREKGQ